MLLNLFSVCYCSIPVLLHLEADQLRNQMLEKRCFFGFKEMALKFWPTYRFLRETYDADGNRVYNDEKARIPSWCDRILWRTFPDTEIEPVEYDSVPSVDTSDHVPVFALFKMQTRISPYLVTSIFGKKVDIYGAIVIKDLKAVVTEPTEDKNKKKPRTPSPFIKFYAPWLPKKSHTPIAQRTFSPSWSNLEFLVVNVFSKEYFETQHVLCEIVSSSDNSVVGKTAQSLGQSVISMKGTTGPYPKHFNEPLVNYGGPTGHLSGSIHFAKR